MERVLNKCAGSATLFTLDCYSPATPIKGRNSTDFLTDGQRHPSRTAHWKTKHLNECIPLNNRHLNLFHSVFLGKTGGVDLFVGSALTGRAFKAAASSCKGECVGSYSEVIHNRKKAGFFGFSLILQPVPWCSRAQPATPTHVWTPNLKLLRTPHGKAPEKPA